MKRRNKILLTVGTLAGLSGSYTTISDTSLIDKYVQKGIDITTNVKKTNTDSLLESQFRLKEVNKLMSTQKIGEHTFIGEFGCGANHHIEGGCGSNHMPEEKYDSLPSEHNPGNRLQETE
jgi:hypothetical protein